MISNWPALASTDQELLFIVEEGTFKLQNSKIHGAEATKHEMKGLLLRASLATISL